MGKAYTVTQVNAYLRDRFQEDEALQMIPVQGEVSNCKYHTSGHLYFTLKDPKAQLACVMFAGSRSGLQFEMADGDKVTVLGSIGIYEAGGRYQMYARQILPQGTGALYLQFAALKEELEQAGYFQEDRKIPIPKDPKVIGIVTAKTGAAVQDMIQIAHRRNPYLQLVLYPSLVQGEGAAASIARGIGVLEEYGVDVIIVGRGGGSLEDLWAFNEKEVVEAIYRCRTPVISAVGHETDTTLSDYVADLRAPTPSAAAELAVPLIQEKIDGLRELERRLRRLHPRGILSQKRIQVTDLEEKLQDLIHGVLKEKRQKLALLAGKLEGLSPLKKLSMGYVLATDHRGNLLKSITQVKELESFQVELADGSLEGQIKSIIKRGKNIGGKEES